MISCPSLTVITPCSSTKRNNFASAPRFEDLVDPTRRARIMQRQAALALPARDLYIGRHHILILKAVDRLRSAFPDTKIELLIISGGYGVLGEQELVVPYEATFSGLPRAEINQRALELGIHARLSAKLHNSSVAIFLLSETYLKAIEAPLVVAKQEIYLAVPNPPLDGNGVIHIATGRAQAERLGVAPRMLKAVLFDRFVDEITRNGWTVALDNLVKGTVGRRLPIKTTSLQRRLFDQ